MNIIELFLKILGLGQGASMLNNAGGLANHGALAALAWWAWGHRADVVVFNLVVGAYEAANFQTSVGAVMVLSAIVWGLGEVLRRSRGPVVS